MGHNAVSEPDGAAYELSKHERALREIYKRERQDYVTWWVIRGTVVAFLLGIAFTTTGCGLAVGAIGGMSNVSKYMSLGANKAYETAVWGFKGMPAHMRASPYQNEGMYGG